MSIEDVMAEASTEEQLTSYNGGELRFPGESAEYRAARNRLLKHEMELRRHTEAIAAERRALPPGGIVPDDYVFEGANGAVRLSELFAPGHKSLAIYSFMFPRYPTDRRAGPTAGSTAQLPLEQGPCPSCTAILDQLDAVIPHSKQRMTLIAVANAPLARVLTFARERGWRHLPLFSTAGNSYNRDYFGQSPEGYSQPMINVFQKDGDVVRHFWGSEMLYAAPDPGQDPRAAGLLEPLWNLFDLTREGRPEWDEQFDYSCCHDAGGQK
jgi:predicted dithiol-disulfide oxidoreductase (DUF899 family)